MIEICVSQGVPHQEEAGSALLAGMRRHGLRAGISHRINGHQADTLVCWGWRKAKALRQAAPAGRRVLVIEHGFVGDRWQWLSLGWDGLNGNARFPLIDDGGDRWNRYFPNALQPVKTGGDYHLLLGQVRNDMSLEDAGGFHRWYTHTHALLTARFHQPVYFRPHPLDVERYGLTRAGMGLPVLEGTLPEALQGAASAWAFNSNSLVDAALAGVPIHPFNRGAMVWPLAGDILSPSLDPDLRALWAHRLAWCQWSHAEMSSGAAWDAVQKAKALEAPIWSSWGEEAVNALIA